MGRFVGIVPGKYVDVMAPGLSTNPNIGKVIAEQLLREENTRHLCMSEIIKKAGSGISKEAAMLLPPLIGGGDWADIFDQLRTA